MSPKGSPRPGTGRPRLGGSPGAGRSRQVAIRWSDDDLALVAAAAGELQVSVSEFVRGAATTEALRVMREVDTAKEMP